MLKIRITVLMLAAGCMMLVPQMAHAAELPKDANTTCPVMLKEKVDPDLYVDYKDQRVFLCCTKCKRRFANAPEKYMKFMPDPKDKSTTETKKSVAAGQ